MDQDDEPIVVGRSILRTAVVVEMLGKEIGVNSWDIADILREALGQKALGRKKNKSAGNYMGQVYDFLFERDVCKGTRTSIEVKGDDE